MKKARTEAVSYTHLDVYKRQALEQAVEQVFDLRPTAIIRDLDLRRPIYRQLAA